MIKRFINDYFAMDYLVLAAISDKVLNNDGLSINVLI